MSSRLAALPSGALALMVACALPLMAAAQVTPNAPPGLENVGVDEHLDQRIPTDLTFRDHTGAVVRLDQVIRGDRPVLLNLVYHTCPSFCSLVLDGVVGVLAQQPWTVGQEFDVLTISIDPRDTPEIAAERRARMLNRYGRPQAEEGWTFLVAETSLDESEIIAQYGVYPSVERLADALGFRYQWMPRQRQYAHAGVTMMLTPGARVARYLYGIELESNDVRLGLLEASEGRSVSTVERAILFCYRYDPLAQGYTLVAWRVMQVGGFLTALTMFLVLFFLWRRERRNGGVLTEAGPGLTEASARS
ncbi:MAG: SCO family protein [Sandaracinaceae bacterium]